jgi:CRP/FNR family transcriptional regulator, cyclic AMP receptor protein
MQPRQTAGIRHMLEQSNQFRDLAAGDLARLAELARLKRLRNHERMENVGGYDAHLWIIVRGAVRISAKASGRAEHVYAVLGPGNFFGLAAVISKGVGVATIDARAFGATELAWIDGARLLKVLEDRPRLLQHFAVLLSRRLSVVLMLLRDNTACTLPERLVRRLLVLQPSIPRPSDAPAALPMTQEDLARMLGTSRCRTNTELRRLESDGLISTGYRFIKLLDLERLRELAGQDLKSF